jgi:Flp pilus assembly protein TadD
MRIAPILLVLALALSGAWHPTAAQVDDLATARAALREGDLAAAATAIDRHLVAKPTDERARFLKGVILSEQGRTNEAFDVFFALTQDHPELAEPYNNLAVIYASQEQYDKALQIDSSNAAAKNKLSLVRELVASPHAKARTTAAGRSTSAR